MHNSGYFEIIPTPTSDQEEFLSSSEIYQATGEENFFIKVIDGILERKHESMFDKDQYLEAKEMNKAITALFRLTAIQPKIQENILGKNWEGLVNSLGHQNITKTEVKSAITKISHQNGKFTKEEDEKILEGVAKY